MDGLSPTPALAARPESAPTDYRALFAGLGCQVPLLDGRERTYVNLDNAATTPPFLRVVEHINHCAEWYGSVHRGTGFKSLVSTYAFNRCRETLAEFVGADPDYHALIFCGNTTDAVNRLAAHFSFEPDEVVLTSVMEHHSNLLPWRFRTQVDHVQVRRPCGMLDFDDLREKLRKHGGKVRLVALTGASNITGLLTPIHDIARLAHEHGARILVDAAQLVAHRPISLGAADDPGHIDFLTFSGHKMYAPFGSGCLVGPRDFFEQGPPGWKGGGAVELVTLDDVEWTQAPEREEAGTPNLVGICAMARAVALLQEIGMGKVAAHEEKLTTHAMERLRATDGIRVFGGCDLVHPSQRLGVIPFVSERHSHALLAAILGYEWGIGVRNGCFCAHPYVETLLGLDAPEIRRHFADVRAGDHGNLPGFVRASFGLCNTESEIDYLAEAIETIQQRGPQGKYVLDRRTGEYRPKGFAYDFDSLVS
ncbi:aminotransferase class V-fold PLP-dependent enzyme [bacterium]|nr:aminotransferase class V-fold PLP-dependent enzyme [bacterium]